MKKALAKHLKYGTMPTCVKVHNLSQKKQLKIKIFNLA